MTHPVSLLRRIAPCVLVFVALSASAEVPRRGVFRGAQSGDIACYLGVDVAGEAQSLMATYELCEGQDHLIDQPVRFSWAEAQVLAADCEGDPDCGRSETVPLVEWMMRDPVEADCSAQETVVFRCRTGAKQVAVCSSVPREDGKRWLQYRFGKLGQKPEMIWPDDPGDAQLAAEGRVESFAGGGASWLRFRRGDHAYVVYSGIGRWGADGATEARAGVAVERRGELVANLRCDNREQSELGPDWFEQSGVSATDESWFLIPDTGE